MIAPAKLNLCLYLGEVREDGLHELCSLFQPLELADRITVTSGGGVEADEVICPDIVGPNLAAAALDALREAGWSAPPTRVEIVKRIPVAAGLGGGSADAAAVLRLAADEFSEERLAGIAAELGADVPSQLEPQPALVRGAGERVEGLPLPGEWAAVLIPDARGLSTADTYRQADAIGAHRDAGELEELAMRIREAAARGASPLDYTELLVNDLQEAAIALLPGIRDALDALAEVGAAHAMVTGSGPTAVGLFPDIARADAAASALGNHYPAALVTAPSTFL